MNNKLKIALDCDDTIYNCNPFAIELLNKEKGTSYSVEDCNKWISESETEGVNERVKYFKEPWFYEKEPVLEGAQEFVKKLCKIAEVFIVTSVPASCASTRMLAIMRDFPEINPNNIIIATRKDVVEVDILLDDGSHNIINAKAKYPVLMRKPWNKNLSGNLSVNNYDDFLHFVDVVRHSYNDKVDLSDGGILCLVGPSGSGKTAITEELIKDDLFVKPLTTTTRVKRDTETDDSYNFISEEEFIKLRDEGKFLENTVYSGNHYGTEQYRIDEIIKQHKYAVIPIDICGAITIKNKYKEKSKLFFIDRARTDVIMGILERNVSNAEKMQRIISLENEYKNEILCDFTIRNNGSIQEAAQKIKNNL